MFLLQRICKLSLKKKGKKLKSNQLGSDEDETSDSDLEVVEALLARKYSKGRGKYKGKAPLIFFSCEEVCHIAARCPNRENKHEKKSHKDKERRISRTTRRTKVINLVL